ncbi:aminotransferase class I/II-fold pyridoxal phosphate-dependent enzyme [Arenibacter certesii]|nr:aminotransferase class I/II-fold pyridoxal phosphate-dependent enzyme [Arenibacter certesii]
MAKLNERQENNVFRKLPVSNKLVDFSSNDYLGFAKNEAIFISVSQYLVDKGIMANGATVSRLLIGNSELYNELEDYLANFFRSDSALVFNSGYDANIGFLLALTELRLDLNCYLVVDEAHAIGVFGENSRGPLVEWNVENQSFARIVTFGKALGCRGATILGSKDLTDYLVNFARSFIYTTAMPPHAQATALIAITQLSQSEVEQLGLRANITFFKSKLNELGISDHFVPSNSAVHCCSVKGNDQVKEWALTL